MANRLLPLPAASASGSRSGSMMNQNSSDSYVFEGWVESTPMRVLASLKRTYWRLTRSALMIYADQEANSPLITQVSTEEIISVEEDAEFYFVIRTVGAIMLYVGNRQQSSQQPQHLESYKFHSDLAAHLRSVLAPRVENNTFKIEDLYDVDPAAELGSGSFATVYGARERSTGRLVALKAIKFDQANYKVVASETKIPKQLSQLRHPGTVAMIGVHYSKDYVYIATERLTCNLLDFILEQPTRCLNERVTKFVSFQIIAAVSFLKNNRVVHGDLKPENVLLVSRKNFPQIKLCDFGYSRILNTGSIRQGSRIGTENYMPPEVSALVPAFNSSIDTWMCGVIIYVSLTGCFPYDPKDDVAKQVATDLFSPDECRMSKNAVAIIREMMDISPRTRKDCYKFKHNVWFIEDYQFWCDLKAFELTREGSDQRPWWSAELNIDAVMEQRRDANKLADWKEIGCTNGHQ